MARYMDQGLFNELAINLAWHQSFGDSDEVKEISEKLLSTYRDFYKSDRFETELWRAVETFSKWVRENHPGEDVAWFEIFRRAVSKFEPDGKKKRKRLLNGLWFTSARVPPRDRLTTFIRDVMMYYAAVQFGRIRP